MDGNYDYDGNHRVIKRRKEYSKAFELRFLNPPVSIVPINSIVTCKGKYAS